MGRNRVRTLCAFVVILLIGALAFNSLDLVALQSSEQKDAVVEKKPVQDKTDSFSPKVLKPYWVDRNNNDIADSLDEEIANRSARGTAKEYADVIVMLRSKPNVEDASIFALSGGYLTTSPWRYALYGFGGQIPYDQISRFALSDANVLLVEKDQTFYGTIAYAAKQIGARTYVWNTMGLQGDPQSSIAIFDSGIDDSHPDFSPGYRDQDFSEKIVGWNDLVNYLSSPYDDAGHGSHVAGLAAGDGFFSTDASGNAIATWGEYIGPTSYSSGRMFRSGMMVNKTGLIEVGVKWKNTGPGNGYFNSLKLYNGNKNLASSQWTKLVTLNIPNQETWYNMTYNVASTPSGGYDMYHLAFNMTGSNNGQKDNFYYVMTLSWPYSPPADGFQASTGVASQTKLVCAKVLDYRMMGSSSRLISAINWIVPNRVAYHIIVASMSLASGSESSSVDNAVTNLVNSGVTTVVGAGNQFTSHQGQNMIYTPGSVDEVITVAAIDQFDHISDYSSEGGPSHESGGQTVKPDIAAPGGSWNAAVPMFSADSNDQDAYNYWPDMVANDSMAWRGTSMATPMVSGSASIIVQAMGGFSNWQYTRTQALQVKNILLMTATETYPNSREVYPSYSPTLERGDKDVHEGYGRLNLDAAVDAVLKVYTIGTTVTDTLGKPPATTDISVLGQKIAWARKVQLNTLGSYNFTLTVPTDADFDLYLYNSTGTYYGEPVIVAKSTNATTGGQEQIIVTPPYNGTYYLVVKRATEATGDGTFILGSSSNQPQYTLTVNVSPAGSGSVTPNNTGPYYYGDKVQLTAIPTIGWTFSSWSGDLTDSVNPAVITINGNQTVTASFTQLQYTLTVTVSPIGSGSVNLNDTGPYHYGDKVQLTAVPNAGWSFSSWSGDLIDPFNPAVITMNGNKTITAAFTQLQYTLWVTISPSDSGSVSLNNTGPYYYGDGVRLTATPTVGWNFSSWSGDLTGSINPGVITIDGNKTVTATFAQLQYSLTVTVSPADSGSVSLNNTGPYYYGDIVELTAVPNAGWKFSGWTGDIVSTSNLVDITIDGNKTIAAHFSQIEYTLTVTESPAGSGSVNLNNTGPYHYGDKVQLTAVPNAGWIFSNWSGDLTASVNPAVIAMNGNKTVTATFTQLQYTFTVAVSPAGSGSVSLNRTGLYNYGDWVELTALSNAGWRFSVWSGDLSGTTNPTSIYIDSNKTVTAVFSQQEYTLTVTVSPIERGHVSRNSSGPYYYGDKVELTASPNLGWRFSGWTGGVVSPDNPLVITMDGNMTVTAHFTQLEYTLIVTVSPVASGYVSLNATGPYHYGDVIELTATPAVGYSFSYWSGDLSGNTSPTSIFIDGNKTIVANFIQLEYTLTVTAYPIEGGFVSRNYTGPYHYGDSVQLTAVPTTGWAFSHWSEDLIGSVNPVVVIMDGNKTLTATFSYHDVAITEVVPSSVLVYAGNKLHVTVTVRNKGLNPESFNVTLFCNTTSIEMQTVSNLAPNSTATLNFTWNTSGYTYGYYTISANATPVPGEANTFDNTRTYDGVVLTIPGDVNGDTKVDASDLFTLSRAYGSTPGAPNWNLNCDINQDSRVDVADLFVLSKNYENTQENTQNVSRQETSLDAILLPLAALPVFALISKGRNHLKIERKTVRNRSKKRAESIQPKLADKPL